VVLILVSSMLALSCDVWSTLGGNPEQTGFNDGENVINRSNVAQLTQQFIVPGANSQPVFEGDLGFVGVGSTLIAFDRSGVTNCGGSPVVCGPLWSASLPATVFPTSVAGGVVYATVGSSNGLHAFEAAGQQKCSGTPRICLALWSTAGGSYGSVIAAGDRITGLNYDSRRIESFDPRGIVNCSGDPKVCEPIWRTRVLPTTHFPGGMAIAGNRVFQVMQPSLLAFDLAGCTPNPSECAPLWTGPLDGYSLAVPTVVGGRVYVSVTNQAPLETQVRAFDEQGVTGCSGAPLVCTSLWADDAAGPPATILGASTAAAYGRIYAQVLGSYEVYDTASCPGVACDPLFRIPTQLGGQIAVANRVVYASTDRGIAAFDADGVIGCDNEQRECEPLWFAPLPVRDCCEAQPAIYRGRLYARANDGLHVFALS
jgi:hypothetical protein